MLAEDFAVSEQAKVGLSVRRFLSTSGLPDMRLGRFPHDCCALYSGHLIDASEGRVTEVDRASRTVAISAKRDIRV